MTTATATPTPTLTKDEWFARMYERGFRWVQRDDVTVKQDVAMIALASMDRLLLDLAIASTDSAEISAARDALETALHEAVGRS
jgi:hypothetical protein